MHFPREPTIFFTKEEKALNRISPFTLVTPTSSLCSQQAPPEFERLFNTGLRAMDPEQDRFGEEDPAAAFLQREHEELGDIGDEILGEPTGSQSEVSRCEPLMIGPFWFIGRLTDLIASLLAFTGCWIRGQRRGTTICEFSRMWGVGYVASTSNVLYAREQRSIARTPSLLPRRETRQRSSRCRMTTLTRPLPVKTCWRLSQSASGLICSCTYLCAQCAVVCAVVCAGRYH